MLHMIARRSAFVRLARSISQRSHLSSSSFNGEDLFSRHSGSQLAREEAIEKAKLLEKQQREREKYPRGLQGVEAEIRGLQEQMNNLISSGKFDQAVEVGSITKEIVRCHFGKEHPVYASTLNNIGMAYRSMEKWDEAIDAYSEAVRVYKASVGDHHMNTAIAIENHAHAYKAMAAKRKGMEKVLLLDNAESLFNEVLQAKTVALGRDNVQVGMTMQNLGAVLRSKGKTKRASELIEEGKEIVCKHLPHTHSAVATSYNNYAFDLKTRGLYDAAERDYLKALTIRKQVFGDAHQETIVVMNNLAELYHAKGEEEKAVRVQKQILDILGYNEPENEN